MIKILNYFFILIILFISLISSSSSIETNLIIQSTSVFDQIDIEGPFILTIIKGPKTNLEVSGQKDFIPYIITTIDSGTLFIRMTSDTPVPAEKPLKIKISLEKLIKVTAAGTSSVIINKINNENLELRLMDFSKASISGKTNRFSVYASGKSILKTDNFKISGKDNLILVDLSGGVELELKNIESDYLKVNLLGLSSLDITGLVKNLDLTATGSGTLKARHLKVLNAFLIMDDCSEAEINVKLKLKAFLKGVSNLEYIGLPHVEKIVSRLAKIKQIK